MLYYVREYAESKYGGSSMKLDEYETETPPAPVGTHYEIQDPDNTQSGYWVTKVTKVN